MFAKIEISSPVGVVVAAARGEALCAIAFDDHWERALAGLVRRFGAVEFMARFPDRLAGRLRAYLGGDLGATDELPVDVEGTPFQMRVWKALRTIPAGETLSYGEVAQRVGSPEAVRAVGNANGRNPVGLVIPCHRVIHANGAIGGYAGGVPRKRWLLEHERAHANAHPSPRAAYA